MKVQIGLAVTITGVVSVAVVTAFLFARPTNKPAPPPAITASATPSRSPVPTKGIVNGREVYHPGDDEGIDVFMQRYPALARLPHETEYWELQVDGDVTDDKLPIKAVVKVDPKSSEGAIEQQRPHIEAWLQSIGQEPGTYELQFERQGRGEF